MEEDSGNRAEAIFRGEGPYPEPCNFCGKTIEAGERYVITDQASVLHEVCAFLINEDADEGLL